MSDDGPLALPALGTGLAAGAWLAMERFLADEQYFGVAREEL